MLVERLAVPPAASDAQRAYMRGLARRRTWVSAARWGILFLFLAAWEVAAALGYIDSFLLSSPSRMVRAALQLLREGTLMRHIGTTLAETFAGFLIGSALGMGLAVLLWWFPFVRQVSDPYLVILNALPKIALGPVLIVWIGSGLPAIIAMAVLISVIVTLVTVLTGFLETPAEKMLLMRSLGATKWQVLHMVVLPGSVPSIIASIKLGVGLAWVGVIVGEFLVSRAGLGYLIVYGGQVFRLDLVMMATAILCVLAAAMYLAVAALEKRVLRLMGSGG